MRVLKTPAMPGSGALGPWHPCGLISKYGGSNIAHPARRAGTRSGMTSWRMLLPQAPERITLALVMSASVGVPASASIGGSTPRSGEACCRFKVYFFGSERLLTSDRNVSGGSISAIECGGMNEALPTVDYNERVRTCAEACVPLPATH